MKDVIKTTSRKFDQHPLSAAFPPMSKEDLKALREDIKINRQIEPIVIFEGKVLDGWNRYCCTQTLGVEVAFVEFPTENADAARYVWSKNGMRRQMSPSQRAATIVRLTSLGWAGQGRPSKKVKVTTSEDMAKEAHVGKRTIERARIAEKAGLGDKVIDGTMTAEQAAAAAKPPRKRTPDTTGNTATVAGFPENDKENQQVASAPPAQPAADTAGGDVTEEDALAGVRGLTDAQLAELVHGDWNLDAAEKQIERQKEEIAALQTDDTKRELAKYVDMYHAADQRAWQESDKARRCEKLAASYYHNLLALARYCGSKERTGSKIVTLVKAEIHRLKGSP
jgi:hypothetical protein